MRAFLPYTTSQSRQSQHSYTGNALVLDARVSCQAPLITKFNGSGHYSQLANTVSLSKNATMLKDISASSFNCLIAGPNDFSICQIGQPYPGFIGSLDSQFQNSTSYGTAFLVLKGTNNSTNLSNKVPTAESDSEWLDITFANSIRLGASLSLCFAPWDAAILNITLSSTANRTEPQLGWRGSSTTSDILKQHFFRPTSARDSPDILSMSRPQSFLGDLPPPGERPLIQSDSLGNSASKYGSNAPLPQDWSIFMTGDPLITVLNKFSKRPSQVIAADPSLAAIFTYAMQKHSVASAMSSLITVLSMTNYYGQQPAFDRTDIAIVSSFANILYPQDYFDFMLLISVMVLHFAVMLVLVVIFIAKTRLTLLGNAWSTFSQIAESSDLKEYIVDATLKDDYQILKESKAGERGAARARIVRSERGQKL